MLDFIEANALVIVLALVAVIVLLVVVLIAVNVKRSNKWREKEFEHNRDTEMLKVRIGELEKEAAALHEHEAQMMADRDNILMTAHEKADDILEQTMERVQKSEAQIRQNRIIASGTITDARRRISDLMIEVSKRLVIDDTPTMSAEESTPEAVEAAEAEERVAENEFENVLAAAEPEAEAEPVVDTVEEPEEEQPASDSAATERIDAEDPVEEEQKV